MHLRNKCEYEVMTSGEHDCGMLAVVDTYICKSCNEIIDVTVGESGETYTKEFALMKKGTTTFDMEFYQCTECGSGANLVKWNKRKRPCPKCDGKMDENENGEMILWD